MAHEAKNYDHLIGALGDGFLSERQLKAHFTLYGGYVKKLNEIEEKLGKTAREANYSFSDYSELKRREPVALNGTVLHEAYFDNLAAKGQAPTDLFKAHINASFGSWDNWIADVKACVGSAHGWTLTVYDYNYGKVKNNLVQGEHHVGLFPNCAVLVAIDQWEHAYFADYATDKAKYAAGVLEHINWTEVARRLEMVPPLK